MTAWGENNAIKLISEDIFHPNKKINTSFSDYFNFKFNM